jgi:hypothetical protein
MDPVVRMDRYRGSHLLDIDEFSLTPESDFKDFIIEGVDPQMNLFMGISVDLELERAYGDMSVGVYHSIHPETKDILC